MQNIWEKVCRNYQNGNLKHSFNNVRTDRPVISLSSTLWNLLTSMLKSTMNRRKGFWMSMVTFNIDKATRCTKCPISALSAYQASIFNWVMVKCSSSLIQWGLCIFHVVHKHISSKLWSHFSGFMSDTGNLKFEWQTLPSTHENLFYILKTASILQPLPLVICMYYFIEGT